MTTSDTETTCDKCNISVGKSLRRHEKNYLTPNISVKCMESEGLYVFIIIICLVCKHVQRILLFVPVHSTDLCQCTWQEML